MAKIDIMTLAAALSSRHGLKKAEAQNFIKAFVATLNDGLRADKQVKIKELGTFKITSVSARKSVDVTTGDAIMLEGRDKISFTPDKAMADLVNKPFSQFETTVLADDVDFKEVNEKYNFDEELALEDESVQSAAPIAAALSQPVAEEQPAEPAKNAPANEEEKPVEKVEPQIIEAHQPTSVLPKDEPKGQKAVADQVEEQPAQSPEPSEETADEAPEESKKCRWWLWLLMLVAVLLCAGYFFCRQNNCQTGLCQKLKGAFSSAEKVGVENDSVVAVPLDSAQIARQEAQKEQEIIDRANEHPLVKTGAWRIEGIAQSVTVLEGQTFKGISKAYLGDGMECYVEAVNDGKNTVQPGDVIKIPKLITKKAWLKRQNQ